MITPARIEHDWCRVIWRVQLFHRCRDLLDHRTRIPYSMCGTCWEDGLQVAVCHQAPPRAPASLTTGMGTTSTSCLAIVKHAFQLEGIVPLLACGSHFTFCLPILAVAPRRP
ncbi:hypothetical protein AVEN_45769-1 [Araneus ventricosus]|uniref:Uncharacterized protein n=1 Tax=Araneus ventricosus TaxID=182803 RepID=A0A4Y2VZG5_ARAVE|nr:hypothetical protein AVEN_45769-1 [Araneus ventricosus]